MAYSVELDIARLGHSTIRGFAMDVSHLKVVAIDEHAIVLDAIAALITGRDDMILLATDTSAKRGLQAIADGKPDVAIISTSLGDMNGFALIERITEEYPATRVVVLSTHEDRSIVQRALQIGAKAYVSKRSPGEHLMHAIIAAGTGGIYIDPEISRKLLRLTGRSLSPNASSDIADQSKALTNREASTVRLCALGYSAKEIAGQLSVSTKTIEAIKSRACEKLDIRTRSQLVRYAATQGWLSQL